MLDYTRNLVIFNIMLYSVAIICGVGLHHHLRDKDEKIKRIPQIIIGILIIAFELGKQIRNFTGYSAGNIAGYLAQSKSEFSTYALPFHFCSFFFFWQIASLFTKGKVRKLFDQMTYFWALMIALFMLIMPNSIYGGGVNNLAASSSDDLHTLVFHCLVFFYFVNEVALKRTEFKLKDWWVAAVAFVIYGAIAIPMSFLLDANYCSVLDPTVPLPFLKTILENCGYAVYEPVLFGLGIVLGVVVYFALYGVRYLESKIKDTTWVEYGFLAFGFLSYPLTLILNPDKINGPIWFVIMLAFMIVCVIPAVVRRIILETKKK